LHVFDWRSEHHAAGLARDALYLLRPDTYVALADPSGETGAIDRYCAERNIPLGVSRSEECFPMTKKLDGKIAVITGGSEGIGLATAKRLVAEGACVFITGRRQPELDAAVTEIGFNITGVQGDVANLADLERLYETIKVEKGRIDILFAIAGVYEAGTLGEISEPHFDKLLQHQCARPAFFRAESTAAVSASGRPLCAISGHHRHAGLTSFFARSSAPPLNVLEQLPIFR
jgi:hypothetical protein